METELINELKKMNKLLILLLIKDLERNEKIKFLSEAGFQPKDIASIINTTANVVSIQLTKLRKKG